MVYGMLYFTGTVTQLRTCETGCQFDDKACSRTRKSCTEKQLKKTSIYGPDRSVNPDMKRTESLRDRLKCVINDGYVPLGNLERCQQNADT